MNFSLDFTIKQVLGWVHAILFGMVFVATAVGGSTYYVAPMGNNQNAGTVESPWADLTHAIKQVAPGDTILVRGGIYRRSQQLDAKQGGKSGKPNAPITIKNYPGEIPQFYGSRDFSDPKLWKAVSPTLWQTETGSIPGYDVGCIWHDDQAASYKWEREELKQAWDFWFDAERKYVLVYAPANPATLAQRLEIPIGKQWEHTLRLRGVHHIHVEGLTIKYTNTHGIQMAGTHHINIRDCTVSHGGGAWIWEDERVRYGNAIELFNGGHDILVENCTVSHYFDTGITHQGNRGDQGNITIRKNHIHHVKCALEHWANESMNVRDILYEENCIEDSGDNWAQNLENVWGAIRLMRFHPNEKGEEAPKTGKVERFVVRKNKILRCGSTRGGTTQMESPFFEHPSIRLIGGPYVVENNTIQDGRSVGIYASHGFHGTIRNNVIKDCVWAGLVTDGISPKASIQENHVTGCGLTPNP